MKTELFIVLAICVALLVIFAMDYQIEWSEYSPRPGIECVAVHVDHQLDVDCYIVEGESQ